MSYWMSIEVFDGGYAAKLWADAHGDALFESAFNNGAIDWELTRTAWGVSLEVAFRDEASWEAFKTSEAFRNALGTAPEPKTGVLIYRGRSLDSGQWTPRKPKPKAGSGANALSLPGTVAMPWEALDAFYFNTSDHSIDRRNLVHTN